MFDLSGMNRPVWRSNREEKREREWKRTFVSPKAHNQLPTRMPANLFKRTNEQTITQRYNNDKKRTIKSNGIGLFYFLLPFARRVARAIVSCERYARLHFLKMCEKERIFFFFLISKEAFFTSKSRCLELPTRGTISLASAGEEEENSTRRCVSRRSTNGANADTFSFPDESCTRSRCTSCALWNQCFSKAWETCSRSGSRRTFARKRRVLSCKII